MTVGIAVAAVVVVRTPALARFGDVDLADATPVGTGELATPVVAADLDCSLVQRSVDLSWPADPLDGEHDVQYEVLRDGVVIHTVDDPPYRDLVGCTGSGPTPCGRCWVRGRRHPRPTSRSART